MNTKTARMCLLALLCALSYGVVAVGRIPVVMFLSYDPKDIVIALGGFIVGPVGAVVVSLIVALLEMITISSTGPIGMLMNFLSSASFAGVAALVYRRRHTLGGAVLGLLCGVCGMTVLMLLWNYLITPIYMGFPRAAVAEMLIPVFLPFNLLKGGLNAAFTMLLYKPFRRVLARARLAAPENKSYADLSKGGAHPAASSARLTPGAEAIARDSRRAAWIRFLVPALSLVCIAVGILIILIWRGIL